MPYVYSDTDRETDEHALPNIEVFFVNGVNDLDSLDEGDELTSGWYWWPCFPGCLPDGELNGPFETEAEAIADAQSSN